MLVPEHSCCPGWSHDGTRVSVPASAPDGRITTATVNADGAGFNPFALPDATLNIGCAGGGWAPGDATIACQAWDETDALRNGIYTVSSADGSGVTRLTDPQGGEDDLGGYSPDGSQLVSCGSTPRGIRSASSSSRRAAANRAASRPRA